MDKVKFYTFLCLIFLFGSACGDIPLDENWETGSHVQNATLVGTPSTTTKKPNEGLIEKYLGEHKYWKASLLLDEAGFETIVPVEFNVDDNKATIHLPEDVVEVTLKYEDSQLSTETDSEYGIEVSYIGDDESYPLDIYLFKEELSGRLMESESLLTIDDDILYDGKYFVADTLQCENKTIGDYCSDNGNSLFEIVNSKNIEEVTCTCLDGKCIDNPREITIKASLKILDLCDNTQIKPPDSFNAEDIDDQQESINSNTQGLMDLINK